MADAMTEIQGTCDERFAAVRTAFQHPLRRRTGGGRHRGRLPRRRAGGRPAGGTPTRRARRLGSADTITNVWSTTKTMTNLCALILADHGEIDLHVPVAKYWPSSRPNDKDESRCATSSPTPPGWPAGSVPVTAEDLYDWEKVTSFLAAQAPWWEPGTASGHHAVTQGYLVGEVVRYQRPEPRPVLRPQVVPLGADFSIGLPTTEHHRVAPLVGPETVSDEALAALQGEMVVKVFANPILSPRSPPRRTGSWRAPGGQRPGQRPGGGGRPIDRVQPRRGPAPHVVLREWRRSSKSSSTASMVVLGVPRPFSRDRLRVGLTSRCRSVRGAVAGGGAGNVVRTWTPASRSPT